MEVFIAAEIGIGGKAIDVLVNDSTAGRVGVMEADEAR